MAKELNAKDLSDGVVVDSQTGNTGETSARKLDSLRLPKVPPELPEAMETVSTPEVSPKRAKRNRGNNFGLFHLKYMGRVAQKFFPGPSNILKCSCTHPCICFLSCLASHIVIYDPPHVFKGQVIVPPPPPPPPQEIVPT